MSSIICGNISSYWGHILIVYTFMVYVILTKKHKIMKPRWVFNTPTLPPNYSFYVEIGLSCLFIDANNKHLRLIVHSVLLSGLILSNWLDYLSHIVWINGVLLSGLILFALWIWRGGGLYIWILSFWLDSFCQKDKKSGFILSFILFHSVILTGLILSYCFLSRFILFIIRILSVLPTGLILSYCLDKFCLTFLLISSLLLTVWINSVLLSGLILRNFYWLFLDNSID